MGTGPAPEEARPSTAPTNIARTDAHAWRWRVGVVAFAFVFHLTSLGFGFLEWDDPLHVSRNNLVVAPQTRTWTEHLTTPALGYPIPVTVLTYRAEAAAFGVEQAWPFHLTNVLLAAGCVLLALEIGVLLGLSRAGAALAALFFALHPVAAEPIAWISGRKDLLALLLGLIALWLAWPVEHVATPRNATVRRWAAVFCFAVALLAKPTIAPLPALVLLAHACYAPAFRSDPFRRKAMRLVRLGLPYLAVLVPIAYLGVVGQRAQGAVGDDGQQGASYLRSLWYAAGHHVDLLFFLEEPTAKYLPSPWPPVFSPRVDLAPVALLALAAFAIHRLRGPLGRAALFGSVWAALTYAPSSGLIPLTRYLADSYVFEPLLGVAWMLGAVFDSAWAQATPRSRRLYAGAAAVAMALVGALWVVSAARFHDDEALWAHARARFPESARVCRMWANGVAKVRGPAPGLVATDTCIEQFGDGLFVKNRGLLLAQVGRLGEAQTWLLRAQALSPADATVKTYLDGVTRAIAARRGAPQAPKP